ncbi:MAG TPA: hypothetical protein PK127_07230 [Clostridiales bacterium]|nr:hypothetical protein [Clostridiales bacterium]HPV02253.1 hypothetical protein [Clostridiales bacterium]
MKKYINKSLRVLYTYLVADLVFIVFLYPLLGLTKTREAFLAWLPWYSILMFIFLFYMIYVDQKELAIKEKKPIYNLKPNPLRGMVYGLIGAVPLAVVTAVLKLLVRFQDELAENIKRVVLNGLFGPLIFVVKWCNDAAFSYFAAILLVPVVTALGYLAGYYGFSIREKIFGKKPVQEKGFTKSPWNPSLNETKPRKKKKKSTGKARSTDKAVNTAKARETDKTPGEDISPDTETAPDDKAMDTDKA